MLLNYSSSSRRFQSFSTIFLFIFITTLSFSTFAAPGDLDTTFGNAGKVITPVGKYSSDQVFASAIQPDGKIIVAGRTYTGVELELMLSRINPDGTLDTTFGQNGIAARRIEGVNIPLSAVTYSLIRAIAIQPDGKIVAAGSFTLDTIGDTGVGQLYFYTRLNANGSFDTTFGENGLAIQSEPGFNSIRSISLQSDGKIIAVGDRDFQQTKVFRINSDGSIDTNFGNNNNGSITVFDEGNRNIGNDITVQTDEKIVICGYNDTGFTVARLNPNGTLDTSFDADGKVMTTIESSLGFAYSIDLQTDGKIVVAGNTSQSNGNTANNTAVIVRYNSDGSLDTTFDGDGIKTSAIGLFQTKIISTKIQSDGKILIGGYSSDVLGANDFMVARLNSDGSFDTGFDSDGIVKTAIGSGSDIGYSLEIQTDNKIVLAGYSSLSTTGVAVTRYNTNGSLDTSFDKDGIATFEYGNSSDEATAVAIQTDGKIITGGNVYCCNFSFGLVRYNQDGSVDTSFGNNGIVDSIIGTNRNYLTELAIQSDGKILTVGYSNNNNNDLGLVLARYNSDGSLDQSFGTNGAVISNRSSGDSIAIQSDGKILVGGSVNTQITQNVGFVILRFNSDGTPDNTFGTNGEVRTTIFEENHFDDQRATAIKIQSDGKIVVGGTVYIGIGFDNIPWYQVVLRYNPDGSLDTTFSDDGFVSPNGWYGGTDDLEIQSDGKILIVNGYQDFAGDLVLSRFNSNGSIDTSFNGNGSVITQVANGFAAGGLSVQPNGKILVGGSALLQNHFDFALVQYNSNGSPDTNFGSNGKVITDIRGNDDKINDIALQSNGSIIATGYSHNGLNRDFATVRYSALPSNVPFDFDGDGKSDISVFRPSEGNWYLLNSTEGFSVTHWGNSSDKIAPADFNGDGTTDFAVFRPGQGFWYILEKGPGTQSFRSINFGMDGDIPVPADFDGNGSAEIAVFRPSEGKWHFWTNGLITTVNFGLNGDIPFASDFDGDGKSDIAVFRPSSGIWYILQSSDGQVKIVQFGIAEDKPVLGDFDGDRKTDISVWRPSTGVWYRINSSDDQTFIYKFGATGDIPSVGDFDGDGKSDLTVFRPSNGVWYRLNSSDDQFDFTQFGLNGDKPIPAYYVP